MFRKLIVITISTLLVSLSLTEPVCTGTQQVGLKDGSGEYARILCQNGQAIQLSFTPPSSHRVLLNGCDGSQTPYNLHEGYLTEDDRLLPAVTYWVVVPPHDRIELEIVEKRGRRLSTADKDASHPFLDRNAISIRVDDPERYNPPAPAVMGKPQVMRGVRMVPVTIFPLQIRTDKCEAVENSEITVNLAFSHGEAVNPVNPARTIPMTPDFAAIIDAYAINPPPLDPTPRRDPAATELSRMLILYPEAIEDETALEYIDEFAAWKRRTGLAVEVVPVEIDQERDRTAEIKEMITDFADDDPPLEFVTIIGNEDTRELNNIQGSDPVVYFPAFRFIVRINEEEEDTTWAYSDHFYSTLDGEDDMMPDVIVSRFKVPNIPRLIGALQRSIEYERNPYVEEDDWYSEALVSLVAFFNDTIPIPWDGLALINWEERLLSRNGYDVIRLIGEEMEIEDEIHDTFEEGVSLGIGEGWLYGCVEENPDTPDIWEQWETYACTGRKNPFVITNMIYYGEPMMYPFFAAAEENTYHGAVAGIGFTVDTWTRFIYPTIGSALRAMMYENIFVPGHLQIITKMHLLSLLEHEDISEAYVNEAHGALLEHWTLGDPAIDIFSAAPIELTVNHPDSYLAGETSVVLHVADEDENEVEDAVVCIRQEDGIQYVAYTDGNGRVAFTIPEGLVADSELQITARKHNFIPYLEDIPVVEGEVNLVLCDHGFDDSDNGDDADGKFRNGEEVELVLTLSNTGNGDAENITALLSCDSERLSYDDEPLNFGDIPSDETGSYEGSFTLTLDENCPGRTIMRLQADIYIGDDNEFLTSVAFEIVTSGPMLSADRIEVDNETFVPGGEMVVFSPIIANLGDMDMPAFDAELTTDDERITVSEDATRSYNATPGGSEGSPGEPFLIEMIDPLFVPNNEALFELHISSADEDRPFDTTLAISQYVLCREAGEPLGPDDYGYICFDIYDYNDTTEWYEAPEFNWREINWDAAGYDFHGTKLDLLPNGSNFWNGSAVVDLPFDFVYYGENFDMVTICTNGWLAMGDIDTIFSTPHNRPIPGYSVPGGQLCILWQDIYNLRPTYNGLFYHYIEEEGVFVVEWSNVQVMHRVEDQVVDYTLSFQILLFDPEVYLTPTGDGDIVFQYKYFQPASGLNDDRKYATVGIRNLDDSGGIQYAYWNEYAPQAHPIDGEEFAIKFTTAPENDYSSVIGRIVRFEDQDVPLAGAIIYHPRFTVPMPVSNAQGDFRKGGLRTGRYDNTQITLNGFNDVYLDFNINAGRETDLGNIPMTHPEISVETSPEEITDLSLRPDGTQLHVRLNLENEGNGALKYDIKIVNHDNSDVEYRNVRSIGLVPILHDYKNYGAVYVDSLFYIPGANEPGNDGTFDHLIYVINWDGELVRSFSQPMSDSSEVGIENLAWDGRYLWGCLDDIDGISTGWIIRFDRDGNRNLTIDNPFDYFSSLAIVANPENSNLFIADQGTGVVEIDTNGNVVNDHVFPIHRPRRGVRISGLGWNDYDQDNMKLYILEMHRPDVGASIPLLLKMNHQTGKWREIGELYHNEDDNVRAHRGMTIIHDYDYRRSHMALVEDAGTFSIDGSRDTLRIYEIGPNITFLEGSEVINRTGVVDPAGRIEAGLLIKVEGWPEVDIPFGIRASHNAAPEAVFIPVTLHVDDSTFIPAGRELLIPEEFVISAVYPNPFNSMVNVEFCIDVTRPTTLKVYNLMGREVATLYEGKPVIGFHRIAWDGSKAPSGIYILKLESAGRVRVVKTALVK